MPSVDTIAETPRLALTTWHPADADAIAPLWLDAEMMRYAGAVPDRAGIDRALTAARAAQATHGVCLWAVRRAGEVIGDCGFHAIGDGVYELGYHFMPSAQSRGYATEAARAALAHAFGSLGARVVLAWSHPDNVPSIAVLRRCGFVAEGPDAAEDGELRFRLTAARYAGSRVDG